MIPRRDTFISLIKRLNLSEKTSRLDIKFATEMQSRVSGGSTFS
jgi:hypothetical protein